MAFQCSTPLKDTGSKTVFESDTLSPVSLIEDSRLITINRESSEIFPSIVSVPESDSAGASQYFPSVKEASSENRLLHESFALADSDLRYDYVSAFPESVATVTDQDTELAEIVPVLIASCCDKQCLRRLCALDVLALRSQFKSLNQVERRQWLMDRLSETTSVSLGNTASKYYVSGKQVCQQAWCKVLSVSQKSISRMLSNLTEVQYGVVKHGNKGKSRPLAKTEDAIAWMGRYFKLVGDQMPHNNQIHLPSWDSRKYVYERYKEDVGFQGSSQECRAVSLRSFYRIWNENFRQVVIPEQDRFAKCDICVKIKMERKATLRKEGQGELKERLEDHLQRVMKERKKYHQHREKSRAFPEKYVTIIIDGMDQAKTNLPFTRVISKSSSGLWRLRTHVTGALVHTKSPCGKLSYAFIDLLQWPHDSNLTITILFKLLLNYSQTTHLPDTLYLQLDNTARENKNRYVLGFCAFLVERRILRKIRINFLPVGHTHEDVDQLFSKVATEIRRSGIECIKDLVDCVTRSSTPNPITTMLDGVWDFKAFIDEHLHNIKNHSKYLYFRFTFNDPSGKAEMHYKRFSDLPWEPEADGGLILLKNLPSAGHAPVLVEPLTDKLDLDHLLRDLPKYKPWIRAQAWQEWEIFMHNVDELSKTSLLHWDIDRLVESGAARRAQNQELAAEFVLPTETLNVLEKENAQVKKVVVEHRKRPTTASSSSSVALPTTSHTDSPQAKMSKTVKPLLSEECTDDMEAGEFIGLHCPKYNEQPQIGKVIEVSKDEVHISWFDGTYTGVWRPYTYQSGHKSLTWNEHVPREDVIVRNVNFTASNKLTQLSIRLLKSCY